MRIICKILIKIFVLLTIGIILQLSLFNFVFALTVTKPNVTGPFGTEVNSYTGELFYQRTDLYIPGRGLDLTIQFSYNSGRTIRDWGYGRGWSFSYGMQYYFENTSIIIERPDGQKDEFVWNGSFYEPPVGVYDEVTEYETDKYLLTTKYGIKYYFEESSHKKITKIEDRNCNTMVFTYNEGLLATITDPSERQVNLNWENDHLIQITDFDSPNRVINYEYDDNNNMTIVTDPAGNSIIYEYGELHNMTSITDARSNTATITYHENLAVAGLSTSLCNKTFIYNIVDLTTTVTQFVSSGNRTTEYLFDTEHRVIDIQLPSGDNISYTWDSNNNIISYTDANGNPTNYTYDDKGNKLSETDCLGNNETYTYETSYNQITSITDKRGNTTTYDYDTNGNLISITYPIGNETFTYDSFGNRKSYTDKNGNETTYTYDACGYMISEIDPLGNTEAFTYDPVGNTISFTDKNGCTTTYTYNELDILVSTTDALGNTTTYIYDENRNLISKTSANGCTTTYTYDELNRLTTITNALGGTTNYEYDDAGNKTSETDENGNTTTNTYDLLNRLISPSVPR